MQPPPAREGRTDSSPVKSLTRPGSQGEYGGPTPPDHVLTASTLLRHIRIADDVLRDLCVRGKYRDVVLPMTVLRRLDAVLEPTNQPDPQLRVEQ